MESIFVVEFLAFPVSFDLVDETMGFCLKILDNFKHNWKFVDSTCLCFCMKYILIHKISKQ